MRSFSSLAEVAGASSALVEATPTGRTFDVPLPPEHGGTADSAPTTYVELKIDSAISGSVMPQVIRVVDPGTDEETGESGLLTGGPHLLYLAPAVYDRGSPAGGYVIVGGSAGWYAEVRDDLFARVDDLFDRLPARVNLDASELPSPRRSERELIASGGF